MIFDYIEKRKEYRLYCLHLGANDYKCVFVTSKFSENIRELLKENLPRFNALTTIKVPHHFIAF